MTLFAKIFTTEDAAADRLRAGGDRHMKALSAHYDFSWARALAQG